MFVAKDTEDIFPNVVHDVFCTGSLNLSFLQNAANYLVHITVFFQVVQFFNLRFSIFFNLPLVSRFFIFIIFLSLTVNFFRFTFLLCIFVRAFVECEPGPTRPGVDDKFDFLFLTAHFELRLKEIVQRCVRKGSLSVIA